MLLLPYLIFPLLTAAAAKYMLGHIYESGLAAKINSHCGIPLEGYSDWMSSTNFRLPYTGIAGLDAPAVCGCIVFFHAVMDSPKALPFIQYFVATGAPYTLITIVEGNRKGQKFLLRFPVLYLLLTQIASFGASYPLFCLLWVASGGVERAREFNARSFSHVQAESIAFAILIGGVLPSMAMFVFDRPFITWIWQLFPVYISVAQRVYLRVRSTSQSTSSGHSTMRIIYISTFLVSACVHLSTVWTHMNDLASIVQLLYPSTKLLDQSIDIDLQTLHALKWDFTLGYIAACTALLWYAQNVHQFIIITLWYLLATPLLGLGTAFIGIAMWRDGILRPM